MSTSASPALDTDTLRRGIVQGVRAACVESCRYADGGRVLAESMVLLRDGRIAEQILIQAWDA
ncbi:hypothetical protein [Streptomyces sp. NPDC047453]|uniref:hypothetical protein n=1 Tax=Streptomyces sp. NPDC047453 TaxID=3154812 RepID=UPI0033CF8A2C